MIIPQKYLKLREEIGFDCVSLGYIELNLFKVGELINAQVGYRIDSNGNSLIDNENGSWKDCWIVIGYEDNCGDPIFIDCYNEEFPVFTAMHGAGEWEETLISDTFESFIKSLRCIQNLSKDRENPVKIEKNPITDFERSSVLNDIRQYNINADLYFWENWLEQE